MRRHCAASFRNGIRRLVIQYTMSNSKRNHPSGTVSCESTNKEQIFCDQAMESGEYDLVSDSEWVAKCEGIAQQVRLERKRIKGISTDQSNKQAE